jgi:hypothetical protein
MQLSRKFIALTTISVCTGLALSGNVKTVSAQTNYRQISQPLQFQPQLCTKPSIIGNWQGMIVANGDDAATYLEISIPSGKATQQGTWKFLGASGSLNQGKAIAVVEGNTVTLELWNLQSQNNLNIQKKIATLQGSFQDCGSKIKGNLLSPQTNFVFNLAKF